MRRRLISLSVAKAAAVAEATFASSYPERNDLSGARVPPSRTNVSLRGDSLRLSVAMQMERRRS